MSNSTWIPLMEYAVKYNVSLSTLRRQIKAHKILYRSENGRYFLQDLEPSAQNLVVHPFAVPAREMTLTELPLERIQRLEEDLRKTQEEVAELKMLLALYEEKLNSTNHYSYSNII